MWLRNEANSWKRRNLQPQRHIAMRETSRRVAHHFAQQLGHRFIVAGAGSTRFSTFLDSWRLDEFGY
jgi:hypothetical protein